MKRNINLTLLFICFLLSHKVYNQTPDYFANNPQWRQIKNTNIGGPYFRKYNWVFYVQGDTLINTTVYKKIGARGLDYSINYSSPVTYYDSVSYDTLSSFLRQDSLLIYRYYTSSGVEGVLYNFDINVGDTLGSWSGNNYVFDSIDSILIGTTYRKIYNFTNNGSYPGFLIEGVGFKQGLMAPYYPTASNAYNLECFALNDTTYYPFLNASCDLSVGINGVSYQESINIYPLPATNILYIDVSFLIKKIQIISLTGQIISPPITYGNNYKLTIDLMQIPSGIYFIRVLDVKDQVLTRKFIKI